MKQRRSQFKHIQPLLATRADDSRLRREALVKQYSGNPEYRWILLEELLDAFPKPQTEFKTMPNDFVVRMPWAVARESGFIADIPYTFEILFRPDTTQLDCRVEFEFNGQKIGRVSDQPRDSASGFVHEHKLRFKLFPETGTDATGIRDLPFAVAETGNRYVEGNYWTAVAGDHGGVAFFNRGTMGTVREADGGFSMPLAYAMIRNIKCRYAARVSLISG